MRTLMNALWIAENDIKQSFKSVRNITWTFLFPIFMMLALSLRLGGKGIDLEYMSFLIPGIVAVTAMFGATNETMSLVMDRMLGTFDRILAAPVSSTSIIVGKTVAGTVMGFISAIVLMMIGAFIYNVSYGNIALVFLIIMLLCVCFTGIGIIISGLSSEPREANMLFNVLRFPLMLMSGIFFPVETLPIPLQWVSRLFPLTYATEVIRALPEGLSTVVYIDIAILIIYAFAVVLVGSKILMKIIIK